MREIWFATLFMLAVSGTVPAYAQPAKPDAETTKSLLAINDQDRVLGKSDAPITIVEYASLTCPHCAHFEATVLPDLKKNWIDTGKVKLVMRDFPLDQLAMKAEMLARCVPADRFYPLTESLFATQQNWVVANNPDGALQKQALFAGVGKKEFDACMANKGVEDQVAQSRLTASKQLGVDSTPTFFINGQKFTGEPTIEAFTQLLNGLAAKS
ncbi:MAG: DsbA family protein [Alphaproteobacteria bacterium]|nr:DsbA family protein [Alphaproteobacteria bacterium]